MLVLQCPYVFMYSLLLVIFWWENLEDLAKNTKNVLLEFRFIDFMEFTRNYCKDKITSAYPLRSTLTRFPRHYTVLHGRVQKHAQNICTKYGNCRCTVTVYIQSRSVTVSYSFQTPGFKIATTSKIRSQTCRVCFLSKSLKIQ